MFGKILSSIFGTSSDFRADTGGQNFAQALAHSQGQFNDAYNNQGSLAATLAQQMNGNGPNPAQAMLNQATDKNIKTGAALIAGANGASPALAQRLAAQNAANMNQESAAQAATLNANQQLSAEGQLGNIYGNMGSQALQSQGIAQGALNANNQINSGVEMANTQSQNGMVGGLLNGAGAVLGGIASRKAHGGMIEGPEVVPGDDEQNDIVPVLASPGEIVIPKSKASDPAKAKAFIDAVMKQKSPKKEDGSGYGKILDLKRRIAALEKKVSA